MTADSTCTPGSTDIIQARQPYVVLPTYQMAPSIIRVYVRGNFSAIWTPSDTNLDTLYLFQLNATKKNASSKNLSV